MHLVPLNTPIFWIPANPAALDGTLHLFAEHPQYFVLFWVFAVHALKNGSQKSQYFKLSTSMEACTNLLL